MAVTGILTTDAPTKIDIAIAFSIPDFSVLGTGGDKRGSKRDRSGNTGVTPFGYFQITLHIGDLVKVWLDETEAIE
jgi:hypothetical protein